MAGTKSPANSLNSGEGESIPDMIFGFLEDSEFSSESSCDSSQSYDINDDQEDDENSGDTEENKCFWESQDKLLKETLRRTSSVELNIRQVTKEIVKELKLTEAGGCGCRKTAADGCRRCLQREISDRLRKLGYNCGVCKAKWMSSKEVSAGEHTYIEVMDTSNSKKQKIKVIIELNFRAEFEMAKASQEYNQLISQLPEVYVGKTKRLEALIKILCSVSKKSMKNQKMHIAPWRKLKYMQAKWHGVREFEISTPPPIFPVVERSNPSSRSRVSLLTFDLVENLSSGLRSMAIKVV